MRLGSPATGEEITVDDFTTVRAGCGNVTLKLPTPSSNTPSTPSLPMTLMVQVPSAGTGVAGSVKENWNRQVAAVVELQVAGAFCAVIGWLFTCTALAASRTVIRALEMSKLPKGSLMTARTNTVAPGKYAACCAPPLNAALQVSTLSTLMTVALFSSTRE